MSTYRCRTVPSRRAPSAAALRSRCLSESRSSRNVYVNPRRGSCAHLQWLRFVNRAFAGAIAQTAFEQAREMGHRQTHDQIERRHSKTEQQELARRIRELAISRSEFPNGNRKRDRRIFEKRNEVVGHRRQRDAERLRQDDAAKRERRTHAERV